MIVLPQEIWCKIYEYDSTYVHCFNEVLKELKTKNCYFRIRQTKPLQRSIEMSVFQMSYLQAKHLCDYWNEEFGKKYKLDLSGFLPKTSFYYPEHISDVSNIYPIIDPRKHVVFNVNMI
jgi:hypothetical protein